MPSPDQQMKSSMMPSALADLLKPVESSLAWEVSALREEIAALRDEIKPLSSLILTGQQVVEEFKRLRQ